MLKVFKKIQILDDSNFSIIKHHIQQLELSFECDFNNDTISFYDKNTYIDIKQFIKSLNIKTKLVKE